MPEFSFETVVLEGENVSLYIKSSEYVEPDCSELLQTICDDMALVQSKTGDAGKKVTLCLADTATVNYTAKPRQELYCTKRQIQNGEYRMILLEEMYQLHDYGTLVGLSSYLFSDDAREETVDLAEYYADPSHMPTLSLFAAYFHEAFADPDTIMAAEETAHQFVQYLLETGGMEKVLACGFSEDERTAWLQTIGVTEPYHNLYETDFLKDVVYRETFQYPLVLQAGNHRYNLIPMNYFSTPAEVWQAFAQYSAGMKNILAYIQENAPSAYDKVLENWQKPMVTTFQNNMSSRQAPGSVLVWRVMDWIHETAHILLDRLDEKDGIWTQEGMATYLSCFAGETLAGDAYHQLLTLDYTAIEDDPSKDIGIWLVDYYNTHWQQEGYDPLTYYRGWGVFPDLAGLPVPESFSVITRSCAEHHNAEFGTNHTNQDGNELTYFQAMLIFDYLSEQFGFASVMDYFFNDISFSEQFSMTHTDALNAAVDYFR